VGQESGSEKGEEVSRMQSEYAEGWYDALQFVLMDRVSDEEAYLIRKECEAENHVAQYSDRIKSLKESYEIESLNN
jgi:hypothetical protein